jgi:hypothetical protein
MEQFRDMMKQIISEEKEKDRASAPMRFQADPMLEARNQTRQMIAEEMARERQRQAQFGANIPTTSGGEVHGHGEGGTSKGPTMQAGTNFGHTASVGNSKANVAMPPKFNPAEHSWMLWRPQVVSYFEMIGLEGILDEKRGDDFSLQVNRYAIGTLQQISPSQDAAWMSTLRLRYAYEAWDQLQKAYGSRAELDMQKKLFEFESAAQRENESVREWAIRLERQVTELNVMAKEAAKEDVMGYNEHRDMPCVTKRREKGEGRKRKESKQETKRHTQGVDPATQADTEHSTGGKAALEQTPTETEKSNHTQQKPNKPGPQGHPHRHQTQTRASGR